LRCQVRPDEIAANRDVIIQEHQNLALCSAGARIAGRGALSAFQSHH
jgi:hypothetical protein